MPLDDFAGGQSDRTGLLQKRVQANQHTRLGNDGRLLNLDHIAVFQRFNEVGLHIGVGLTGGGLLFGRLRQCLDLLCDHIHDNSHAVPGSGIFVFYAGQALESTGRVKVHVVQIGQIHKFGYVGEVDAAHCLKHFQLFIQLCVARGHTVRIGEHHANKVEYFGGGGAGILHVGQMQSGRDCHCALRFTGTGRATQQKITHLHGFTGGNLGVLADIDHLIRDDVPVLQLGNKGFLQNGEFPASRQLILTDKIPMVDGSLCRRNSGLSRFGKDGKFTCQNGSGGIDA